MIRGVSEKMDYSENPVCEEVRQLVIVDRFSVDLKEKILALLDKVRQAQALEEARDWLVVVEAACHTRDTRRILREAKQRVADLESAALGRK